MDKVPILSLTNNNEDEMFDLQENNVVRRNIGNALDESIHSNQVY